MKTPVLRSDRRLFMWISLAIVVFVFVGFSRTYYLHSFFHQPSPSGFLQFHGALMSGWIVLLFGQSALASAGQVRLHRQIGTLGACYASLIPIVGSVATFRAAAREVAAHSAFAASQLDVLALELTQVILFSSLVACAIWLRNRPEYHKRLMLLATLCILPNVIVRISLALPFALFQSNQTILLLWIFLVAVIVSIDSVRRKRLHPALGYGAPIAIVMLGLAYFIGRTDAWQTFGTRLVS